VTVPWSIKPDATSEYQVGGVPWWFLTKSFDWYEPSEDREVYRRFAIFFRPCRHEPAWMHFRYFDDGRDTPVVMVTSTDGEQYEGVGGEANSPYLRTRLTRVAAHAQLRLHGHRELNFDGPRYVEFELSGVAGRDGVQIHQFIVDGVQE
jgi:hypothetical protein